MDAKYNIQSLLMEGYEILKSVGIESYMLDCQLLLGKVLNKDKLFIMLNRDFQVDTELKEQYFNLIELRKNKMPVKYILEECEFMGINFMIKEGVLIPRPDTELLVETALQQIRNNKYKKICDVCTGSGIIGISIGSLIKDVEVDCYDISDTAIEVTQKNIDIHKLNEKIKVYKSDLLTVPMELNKKYDAIVSNPPYIREKVIETLMEDVKDYEPYEALCGGQDGLDFYRTITTQSLKLLNNGGLLGFEIGYDQRQQVSEILEKNNFIEVKCLKDLAGKDRVVIGKLKLY